MPCAVTAATVGRARRPASAVTGHACDVSVEAQVLRFRDELLDAKSFSGDLPPVYAHVVHRDLRNPHMYYAGLENGLYVTWDNGQKWYLFGLGLPNAPVYDLTQQEPENDLIVGTHGRSMWILDDLAPFQQFTPETGKSAAHLFAPPDAWRFWPWSQVEGLGDGAFYGKNPGYGAHLSYFVSKEQKEGGQLIIADAQGHTVRTLKGTHELEQGEQAPDEEELPPTPAPMQAQTEAKHERAQAEAVHPQQPATPTQSQQQVVPPKSTIEEEAVAGEPKKVPWVPALPGLQRMYWDLRSDGPVRWESAKDFNKGPKSGALVPPGTYILTLTVNGESSSQKLEVFNDPSVHASQADMEQRYQLEQAVLHQISQLDVALNRMDAIKAQEKALQQAVKDTSNEQPVKTASEALDKSMKAVLEQITSNVQAGESSLRTPDKLREHLFGLLGLCEGADDALSPAVLELKRTLDEEYRPVIEKYNQLLQADLAAFNREMEQRKLPGVLPGETLQP